MPSNKVPSVVVNPGPGEASNATVSASALDFDASGGGGGEVLARVPWADGTTNPAVRLSLAVSKIVADLTSTANKRGAGKLSSPALTDWADGTPNPATTLAAALDNIVKALVSNTAEYGAGKISTKGFAKWADELAGASSNTPTTVSTAIERIINALTGTDGAGKISVKTLSKWADEAVGSSTNNASTVSAALDRIITALTGTDGASKISTKAFAKWADEAVGASSNTAATISIAIERIITALTGADGAARITTKAFAKWADEAVGASSNTAATISVALDRIINSLTGSDGAGKISIKNLSKWANEPVGTTSNTMASVSLALDKVIKDLTSTTDTPRGAGKITAPAVTGLAPLTLAAGTVASQLSYLIVQTNLAAQRGIMAERRAEIASLRNPQKVYTNTNYTLNDIAGRAGSNGFNTGIGQLVCVGDGGALLKREIYGVWAPVAAAKLPGGATYTNSFAAVARGIGNWLIVGAANEMQYSSSGTNWIRLPTSDTWNVNACAFMPATDTWIAVGDGGKYSWGTESVTFGASSSGSWGTTSLSVVSAQITEQLVAVCGISNGFVVTTAAGNIYVNSSGTSLYNNSWRLTGNSGGVRFLPRQLYRQASTGYLYALGCIDYGGTSGRYMVTAVSKDNGETWGFNYYAADADTSSPVGITDYTRGRMVVFDQQVAILGSGASTLMNAQIGMMYDATAASGWQSDQGRTLLEICECMPMNAKEINGTVYVVGTLGNGYGVIYQGGQFRPNVSFPGSAGAYF